MQGVKTACLICEKKYDTWLRHKAVQLVETSTEEAHKGSIMVWQDPLYQILHMGTNKQVNYSKSRLSHRNF